MTQIVENKYSIKRVSKGTDDDYIKALQIYNETTPTEIKTNTNELTRMLTKKKDSLPFELLIFVLYLDEMIIGLAMLSYVKKQRVMIYDYIAISKQYRVNAAFFSFMSLIQEYIYLINHDVSYFIVEISNKGAGKNIDKESKLFKKLICLEDFRIVNAEYCTLPLGLNDHESAFEAHLYIKTNDSIGRISPNTYLDIVYAIYYEYYVSWYAEFLSIDETEKYKKDVDEYYSKIKERISGMQVIEISPSECPLITLETFEKTSGNLPAQKNTSYKIYIFALLILLVSPILVIWVYNQILHYLNIPISSVNATIGGIFGAMLAAITSFIVFKK